MACRVTLYSAVLALCSTQAIAQSGSTAGNLYVGLVTGSEFFTGGADAFDYNPGYVIGGHVGYRFGQWRVESELSFGETEFRDVDNDLFDIDTIRANASLFYDLPTAPVMAALTPYVGGGLGVSNIEVKGVNFKDDDTGLTLHGEVGMALNVTEAWSLVPQYRYEWFEQGVTGFDDYYHVHSFRLAAQFGF